MNFVTAGHLLASSLASASVIRRHVLPPKPSESASVIFFDPHQDGAAAVLATLAATLATRAAAVTTAETAASLNLKLMPLLLPPDVSCLESSRLLRLHGEDPAGSGR